MDLATAMLAMEEASRAQRVKAFAHHASLAGRALQVQQKRTIVLAPHALPAPSQLLMARATACLAQSVEHHPSDRQLATIAQQASLQSSHISQSAPSAYQDVSPMEAAPLHSMVSLVAIFAKLAPTQQAGEELSAPHVPQDVWHFPGVLLCAPLALRAVS
jgi:hypothetical protein